MKKIKCVLAYVLGILAWYLGIIISIIWNFLCGAYQESNTIDITIILAENITPALVSIFLADYVFKKIFPNIQSKKINILVFYIILFLNYGMIISDSLTMLNYTNLIYVATGVISLIYLIYKLLKEDGE